MINRALAIIILFTFSVLSGCKMLGKNKKGKALPSDGQLYGVEPSRNWTLPKPPGMVYIPPGTFHMGPSDEDMNFAYTARNKQVSINSFWMDATDIVLSGCSLGMHIAIALKKPVIAWFGVSCSQEVDLYGRGVKIQANVGCSPCWKKGCNNEPKCFNEVSVEAIRAATADVLRNHVFSGGNQK